LIEVESCNGVEVPDDNVLYPDIASSLIENLWLEGAVAIAEADAEPLWAAFQGCGGH